MKIPVDEGDWLAERIGLGNTDPSVQLHLCQVVGVMAPLMTEREMGLLQLFLS